MTAPRFLLIGIGGVYNYGCEAIVRGTEALLRQRWPDCRIVYASPRPVDDGRRLADSNVDVVPRLKHSRFSPRNIARKLLSVGGQTWTPSMDRLEMARDCDAVLSIGGDIHTLSPSGNFGRPLLKFTDAVERSGTPCVLWGASVGPFSQRPDIERDVQSHLRRLSLIVTREPQTTAYLQRLGVRDNVVLAADPAFAVAPEIRRSPVAMPHSRPRIAINLSPLSARHTAASSNSASPCLRDSVVNQSRAIAKLIDGLGCDVLLLPHVVCDFNEADDDRRYLRSIAASLPASARRHTEIYEDDGGFLAAKRVLADCDLAIAARMHCGINAVAAEVPTLFLAYSQKAVGMSEFIFGSRDHVWPLAEFGSVPMLTAVRAMLANGLPAMRDRLIAIRGEAQAGVAALAKTLRSDMSGKALAAGAA